jgi:lipoprotein NlpD
LDRAWHCVPLLALAISACIPAPVRQGPGSYQQAPAPPPAQPANSAASPPVSAEPQPAPAVRKLPAPPPAWVARPVTADAALVPGSTYIVRRGDTLGSVADRTGASITAIARTNDLSAPFPIRAGQRLTIPGGRYHLIRPGETGIAIARAYQVEWSRVVAANALSEPFVLRTGQRLLIPSAEPALVTETLEQRAARFHIDLDDILTGGEPALAAKASPARPSASSARVLPATTPVAEPKARPRRQLAWPAEGKIVKRFGPGATGERNDGIKIAVPLKTPVRAAADGVVAYVGSDVPALGGLVIVKHGNGLTTIYGHAGQLLVQRGQAVKRGQMIALSGNSGFADRPELHFEIRQGRTPVDPLSKLPAR